MDILIDAEGLQKAILSQIASTTFGEALAKAANRAFESRGFANKTIIEEAAETEVRRYVKEEVRKSLTARNEELQDLIRDKLTTEVLCNIVQLAIDRMVNHENR